MTMDVEICVVGEACWEGSLVSVLILETGILFPWWPVSNGRVWSQREVVFAPRELRAWPPKIKPDPMFRDPTGNFLTWLLILKCSSSLSGIIKKSCVYHLFPQVGYHFLEGLRGHACQHPSRASRFQAPLTHTRGASLWPPGGRLLSQSLHRLGHKRGTNKAVNQFLAGASPGLPPVGRTQKLDLYCLLRLPSGILPQMAAGCA